MKNKYLLLISLTALPFAGMAQAVKPPEAPGPNSAQLWISFLPVIFFAIILVATILKLRKDKTRLSDLLAEKDVVIPPPSSPPSANGPNPPQSVSRFIAFLSGVTTVAIAACATTFYMYETFTNQNVDLSKLTTVLFGLGIGVLPYGFNKASSAVKS